MGTQTDKVFAGVKAAVMSVTLIVSLVALLSLSGCASQEAESEGSSSATEQTAAEQSATEETAEAEEDAVQTEEASMFTITVGETVFHAEFADNSSAEALRELLTEGPLTLDLSDYASMEKVGALGASLPRNDSQINTAPGDIILYQGNQFVIYYGTNNWSLTRLGSIVDEEVPQLRSALGSGDVTVTLALA